MSEHLPDVYRRFVAEFPEVIDAHQGLADALHGSGPLTDAERRLAKLGIAVGTGSAGAVRSHARRALSQGVPADAIRQVAVLAISTAGFPAAIAAYGWINEVLDAEAGAA